MYVQAFFFWQACAPRPSSHISLLFLFYSFFRGFFFLAQQIKQGFAYAPSTDRAAYERALLGYGNLIACNNACKIASSSALL